jgi:N-acyl-D-aspartate/D-glutamate deacylase
MLAAEPPVWVLLLGLAGAATAFTGAITLGLGLAELLRPGMASYWADLAGVDPRQIDAKDPADSKEEGRERVVRGSILACVGIVVAVGSGALVRWVY